MSTPSNVPRPRATPPRGTTRVTGDRPANQISCPGCGVLVDFKLIGCGPCWRAVPGDLKAKLRDTIPGTFGRARVVGAMRLWLGDRRAGVEYPSCGHSAGQHLLDETGAA